MENTIKNGGRPAKLAPCPKCGDYFGARKLREHLAEAHGSENSKDQERPSFDDLKRLYVDEDQTYDQIAAAYGVTRTSVYLWVKKYELKKNEKVKEPVVTGLSGGPPSKLTPCPKCGDYFGVRKLREHLVEVHGSPTWHSDREKCPPLNDLKRLYLRENKTYTQIAAIYEVSEGTVFNWTKKYGLKKSWTLRNAASQRTKKETKRVRRRRQRAA